VSWKKLLIVPNVIRVQRQAPKDVSTRWDQYWASVRQTGSHGDVLWDSDSRLEGDQYLDQMHQHCDTSLPVVDVGCGNGRFTRMLAEVFPFALGLDISPSAVSRAAQESDGIKNVSFRPVDMTERAAGSALASELGEANVFVRGVFHVLDKPERVAMATNLRDVLGARGTVLLAETNYPGSSLDYLEHLGATATWLPEPLKKAIGAGIPRPSHFGEAELAECFPANHWPPLLIQSTSILTVPMRGTDDTDSLPGYLALLRASSERKR